MNKPRSVRRCGRYLAAVAVCHVLGAGCGLITVHVGPPVDGNRNPSANVAAGRTAGEPNDDFDEALVAVFDASRRARLQGAIESTHDLDVYDLGPLSAGDRIVISVDTESVGSGLDAMIGLFDADENLFIDNDDTAFSLDPQIDETLRHDSDRYYLVVSASTFADRVRLTGAYRVDVEVISGTVVPAPMGQTVFLNFDGGLVGAEGLGISRAPAFDAADIHPLYAGQTDVIKAAIVQTFKSRFVDFNVTTFSSDDLDLPDEPYTTVFFGGFPPRGLEAFGISERVDHFNEDPADVAVIFTETFSPRVFTFVPTADQLGVAIGNIAAHEVGHLLGLNHVSDPTALMDAVSPADTFLEVQLFQRAPLYAPELFPIGFQDAVQLLAEIVGAV